MHVAEEMNDMLGASQQGQIPLDDDEVETMIYQECYVQHSWYYLQLLVMWS